MNDPHIPPASYRAINELYEMKAQATQAETKSELAEICGDVMRAERLLEEIRGILNPKTEKIIEQELGISPRKLAEKFIKDAFGIDTNSGDNSGKSFSNDSEDSPLAAVVRAEINTN